MIRPFIICAALIILYASPAQAQECPATQLNDAQAAIKNASGCQAGIALYESCGAKASSYANLGVLAVEAQTRCEKIFLDELHGPTRQLYKSRQSSCLEKYVNSKNSPFVTPKSICMPYLAEEYARVFITVKRQREQNPNPPL